MFRLLIYTHTQSSLVPSTQNISKVCDTAGQMKCVTSWQYPKPELNLGSQQCLMLYFLQKNSLRSFSRELDCIKRKAKHWETVILMQSWNPDIPNCSSYVVTMDVLFFVLFILSDVLLLPQTLLKATCSGIVVFSLLNNARQTNTNTLHIGLTTAA